MFAQFIVDVCPVGLGAGICSVKYLLVRYLRYLIWELHNGLQKIRYLYRYAMWCVMLFTHPMVADGFTFVHKTSDAGRLRLTGGMGAPVDWVIGLGGWECTVLG